MAPSNGDGNKIIYTPPNLSTNYLTIRQFFDLKQEESKTFLKKHILMSPSTLLDIIHREINRWKINIR